MRGWLYLLYWRSGVYPVALLAFIGLPLCNLAEYAGLYRRLCDDQFGEVPEVDCGALGGTPWAEDWAQAALSRWGIYTTVAGLLPSAAVGLLLGAWGDVSGRQANVLLGLSGVVGIGAVYTALLSLPSFPVPALVPAKFLSGCTGTIGITLISCMAYIADSNIVPEMMSVRMVLFLASYLTGQIIGGFLGGYLAAVTSLAVVNTVGQGFFVAAFFTALVTMKQLPPLEHHRRRAEHYTTHFGSLQTRIPTESTALVTRKANKDASIISRAIVLQKASLAAYIRPRSGHKRAFLAISAGIYLLINSILIGLPTQARLYRRPFEWSPAKYSTFTAMDTLIGLASALASVFGLKLAKGAPDTLLIIVGLASTCARATCLGLAQSDGAVYASIALNALSGIAFPANKAFVSSLVSPAEVGKIFAIYGISLDLGVAFGSIVYGSIYAATVATAPGFVFLFAAALCALCAGLMCWVHVAHKRESSLDA